MALWLPHPVRSFHRLPDRDNRRGMTNHEDPSRILDTAQPRATRRPDVRLLRLGPHPQARVRSLIGEGRGYCPTQAKDDTVATAIPVRAMSALAE